MSLDLIRTMYEYDVWANRRVLDAAARLDPESYRADGGASFGSVHDTLVHLVAAHRVFLKRWQGVSPSALLSPRALPDLPAVRLRWRDVERETRAFVAALREPDLKRIVEYRNTEGERCAYPLAHQMVHQVNHATQHRSEVAMLLTRFGHSPGWLDLLYFLDLRAADARPDAHAGNEDGAGAR